MSCARSVYKQNIRRVDEIKLEKRRLRSHLMMMMMGERTKNTDGLTGKQNDCALRRPLKRTDYVAYGDRAAAGRRATRAEPLRRRARVWQTGVPGAAPGGRGQAIPFVNHIDRTGRSTAPATRYRRRGRVSAVAASTSVASASNYDVENNFIFFLLRT